MVARAEAYFGEHRESESLGRLALRGGVVSLVMQYGNGALQLVASVVLARLLVPEDFGLVAIVAVVTSFAPMLIDFGLGDAATQRSRITPSQISALFWFNTAVAATVALAVAASSPLIVMIFGEPRLGPIALCAAVNFVLIGAANQHLALLRRAMQFGTVARIQFTGIFIGVVVAIACASWGFGYWALVLRPIVSALCIAIGAWTCCRWRPGAPVFDSDVKSMLRFGLHVTGFSVSYVVSRTVDRIGLGLFYAPEVVGYYQNATLLYDYSIMMGLGQLHTVGSASLSKLQSEVGALRQKFLAALSMLSFFAMPLAAILSVTAHDVVLLLLGAKWEVAGALLSIIALRGIFQVIELSQGWLHLSLGRPDRWRNWGVVTLAVQLVAVIGGLPFGPTGVAIATVIVAALIAVPAVIYAGGPIGIGPVLLMRATGRQLIGAIVVVAAGWYLQITFLSGYPGLIRILVSGVFCTCLYLVIVAGLFRLTEPIKVASSVARDLLVSRLRRV